MKSQINHTLECKDCGDISHVALGAPAETPMDIDLSNEKCGQCGGDKIKVKKEKFYFDKDNNVDHKEDV